jgi:hypothetical protein
MHKSPSSAPAPATATGRAPARSTFIMTFRAFGGLQLPVHELSGAPPREMRLDGHELDSNASTGVCVGVVFV